MFKLIRNSLFFLAAFSFLGASCATELPAPDVFMEKITSEVLVDLSQLPSPPPADQLDSLIEAKIVPYVDVPYMARWVAGRRAWSEADATLRQEFTHQFQYMLVRTYSSTLETFKDRKMTYSRTAGKDYHQEKHLQVYASIAQPGKEPISVIYQLRRYDNTWKVFDVVVEGISMLKGLQSQYEKIIATEGLQGAIKRMQEQL